MKIYQRLAVSLQAYVNCCNSGNTEWQYRHADAIEAVMKETAPSGSGFDCGTSFYIDEQLKEKKNGDFEMRGTLRFETGFHHMDENGGYDGWTEHVVTVHPDLAHGIRLTISGPDHNDIKDYIANVFDTWLTSDYKE